MSPLPEGERLTRRWGHAGHRSAVRPSSPTSRAADGLVRDRLPRGAPRGWLAAAQAGPLPRAAPVSSCLLLPETHPSEPDHREGDRPRRRSSRGAVRPVARRQQGRHRMSDMPSGSSPLRHPGRPTPPLPEARASTGRSPGCPGAAVSRTAAVRRPDRKRSTAARVRRARSRAWTASRGTPLRPGDRHVSASSRCGPEGCSRRWAACAASRRMCQRGTQGVGHSRGRLAFIRRRRVEPARGQAANGAARSTRGLGV